MIDAQRIAEKVLSEVQDRSAPGSSYITIMGDFGMDAETAIALVSNWMQYFVYLREERGIDEALTAVLVSAFLAGHALASLDAVPDSPEGLV